MLPRQKLWLNCVVTEYVFAVKNLACLAVA
jgi:hypothetical protein